MKKFSKVALGAIALAVGIGGISVATSSVQKVSAGSIESTYTWTLASGQLSKTAGSYTNDGVEWSWSKISYVGFDTDTTAYGAQLGSSKNPAGSVTFSAALSNFGSSVTKVAVTANTKGSGTISIAANATSVLASTALEADSKTFSATGLSIATSAGNLVITINGATKAAYLKSIAITSLKEDVVATGISLSKTAISGQAGGSETLTATISPSTTTHTAVDWASSNTSVATVTDGVVAFITAGSATITATLHDDTSLSATCTVTVTAAAHTLKKITNAKELTIGAQITILSNGSSVVAMSKTQNANNRSKVDANPRANSLSLPSTTEAAIFTIGVGTASGTYSLRDTNGYLCAASSGSNYLRSEETLDTDGNGNWTIAIDSAGVATLTAKGTFTRNVMQYNATSSIFSCYSSASQTDLVLYEQETYYNAASWAIGFNTALDSTCSNTAPTAISSSTWAAQTTSFGNLGTDEKAILKAIVTSNANDTTATKQAISRYDYVMGKAAYSSFADFIGRFPSRSTTPLSPVAGLANDNSYLPYIALVAGAGAAALFFLARKKKHD